LLHYNTGIAISSAATSFLVTTISSRSSPYNR
jgi:hypothetical protein